MSVVYYVKVRSVVERGRLTGSPTHPNPNTQLSVRKEQVCEVRFNPRGTRAFSARRDRCSALINPFEGKPAQHHNRNGSYQPSQHHGPKGQPANGRTLPTCRVESPIKSPVKQQDQERNDNELEDDVEEEMAYTPYRPAKLLFGVDHPDPVVENATLSAVAPPSVTYNLAMPANIISEGKLSSLQLEAVVYACQRHASCKSSSIVPRASRSPFGCESAKGRCFVTAK